MSIALDDIGTQLVWWGYPDKLFQMIPPLIPADLTLVPILSMIIYQYFDTTWKQFIIANLISGAVSAFLFEPIFVWLSFYQLNEWKFSYSFLFYIVSALIGRWIIIRTKPRNGYYT